MSKSKAIQVAADVAALLRARNPLLWIVSREEARVERYLMEAAASAGYVVRTWDIAQGIMDMAGRPAGGSAIANGADPKDAMDAIKYRAQATGGSERCVWIMRDLPPWIAPPIGSTQLRQLRNLARFLPGVPRAQAQAIIVLTPVADVPAELANHAKVIEWPLPDRAEIANILRKSVAVIPTRQELEEEARKAETDDGRQAILKRVTREQVLSDNVREAAVDAAVGLSEEEAQSCYASSLVQHMRIDPATVAREKKRVIAKEGVLEWMEPLPGGLDAVGGLGNLKVWLKQRKSAYSKRARDYGLPSPRGAVLIGPPGTGKTLCAKTVATAWNVPLLRLDLGALKSKFVGESEQNLRKAFKVIEAIGPCVLLVDEIEKALAGATQGAADGGVSADALGGLLTWMQERPAGGAFILATSNDVSALPPELLRAGRFDSLWYVDLPTQTERIEVVKAALAAHGRAGVKIDHAAVAAACVDFTGAEIAALVPDALFAAFADDEREITTQDLLTAAKNVVPLTKTAPEKINKLREWAKSGRARMASAGDVNLIEAVGGRDLDLEPSLGGDTLQLSDQAGI